MKGNIRMDKFDQYKRLLRLGIAGIEIFIETLFFVYVWDEVYRELRVTVFLNKGNWMMIGFYVLYLVVFVYLYGGTKYAYYKKGQLILSQTLGTIIANALMYIQIIMVVGRFPFPTIWPMLVMSAGRSGGDHVDQSVVRWNFQKDVSAEAAASDLRYGI